MPNRVSQYYVGDIVTFRGTFKIDGVAQTPDGGSAYIQVWKVGSTSVIVSETAATISTNQLQYKYTIPVAGSYAIYFYCTLNSTADKRSGIIEFIVKEKEAH